MNSSRRDRGESTSITRTHTGRGCGLKFGCWRAGGRGGGGGRRRWIDRATVNLENPVFVLRKARDRRALGQSRRSRPPLVRKERSSTLKSIRSLVGRASDRRCEKKPAFVPGGVTGEKEKKKNKKCHNRRVVRVDGVVSGLSRRLVSFGSPRRKWWIARESHLAALLCLLSRSHLRPKLRPNAYTK